MDTPAWRSLSLGARCLLLEVWRRHNGTNNGQISMSVREAAALLGCSKKMPSRWFAELREKGFLEPTRLGSFAWKGGAMNGRATTWRLTMEPCNGERPTKEFASWRPSAKKSAVPLTGTSGTPQGYNATPKPASDAVDGTPEGYHKGEIAVTDGTPEGGTYNIPAWAAIPAHDRDPFHIPPSLKRAPKNRSYDTRKRGSA